MFGAGPLSLLSDAGLASDIVPAQQGRLSPSAFTDYEALMIGGSRVSDAELAGESGKLRVIARNGVLRCSRYAGALWPWNSSHQHASSREDPGFERGRELSRLN